MDSTPSSEDQWSSSDEYDRYIWNLKREGYEGHGRIVVLADFPDSAESIHFRLDYLWLRHGLYAKPKDPGAANFGLLDASVMNHGDVRTFDVAAGPHDVCVSCDVYSSGKLTVIVEPGQTVSLVCSERFSGVQRIFSKFGSWLLPAASRVYVIRNLKTDGSSK